MVQELIFSGELQSTRGFGTPLEQAGKAQTPILYASTCQLFSDVFPLYLHSALRHHSRAANLLDIQGNEGLRYQRKKQMMQVVPTAGSARSPGTGEPYTQIPGFRW